MVSKNTTIQISSEARDTLKELGKVQGTTYSETIAQFAQETPSIGPLARNSGKEQGTIFLSSTGMVYKAPPVTPEKIRKMLTNAYIVFV